MSKPRHRGANPKDQRLFSPPSLPLLRIATDELCWLLNRGYGLASALELVGNRHALAGRQRLAVGRCACADTDQARLGERRLSPDQMRGRELWVDGFNVLLAMEAALGGAVVLRGRDNCCRDMGGVYRRYHHVVETVPALEFMGKLMVEWGVAGCTWWLDAPVGNSARLQEVILEVARASGWPWTVNRVNNPDQVLARAASVVATADRRVLQRCGPWLNLVREAIARHAPHAWLLEI